MPVERTPEVYPDVRRQAIAALLVKGVLRWNQRSRAARLATPKKPPQSSENGLELPAETRLRGLRTRGLWLREDGDKA